jgi:hypothetical protein
MPKIVICDACSKPVSQPAGLLHVYTPQKLGTRDVEERDICAACWDAFGVVARKFWADAQPDPNRCEQRTIDGQRCIMPAGHPGSEGPLKEGQHAVRVVWVPKPEAVK